MSKFFQELFKKRKTIIKFQPTNKVYVSGPTLDEAETKARFSIATTPRCRGGTITYLDYSTYP